MPAIAVSVKKPTAYDITIERGSLNHCGNIIKDVVRGKKCVVVTDSNVEPLYLETVTSSLTEAGFSVSSFVTVFKAH